MCIFPMSDTTSDPMTNQYKDKPYNDFGPNKRKAVYDFFIDVFHLDRSKLDESKVAILPDEALKTKLK